MFNRIIAVLFLLLAIAIGSAWILSNLYHYEKTDSYYVRINKLTGSVHFWSIYTGNWTLIDPSKVAKVLEAEQAKKRKFQHTNQPEIEYLGPLEPEDTKDGSAKRRTTGKKE